MSARRLARPAAVLLLVLGAVLPAFARRADDRFDHQAHARLFVSCESCHAGAVAEAKALFPSAASCASCHDGRTRRADGTVLAEVTYTPRREPPASNLRFTHQLHWSKVRQTAGADSTYACGACHTESGGRWMSVRRAVTGQCLDCHGITVAHYEAPDSACVTCHVPLPQSRVTAAQVARWQAPANHERADFLMGGHGALARPSGQHATFFRVAQSCATCHARDFCASCHVNGPEEPTIRALAADARSLATRVDSIPAPPSHAARGFLAVHGRQIGKPVGGRVQQCQVCHTQESCTACHLVPPTQVRSLAARSPDRAGGARTVRTRPASHGSDYTDSHAAPASGSITSCMGCHVRQQCLDCHRPDPAATAGYHPADYLSRHPAAAYQRETSCADCHNPGQFCQSCHQQSGLTSSSTVLGDRRSFHDKFPGFSQGHGQAARQALESCVSCHTERDCLSCHAAIGGRRVNPHGPGFDPERLRSRNSQACSVCHGRAIPGND